MEKLALADERPVRHQPHEPADHLDLPVALFQQLPLALLGCVSGLTQQTPPRAPPYYLPSFFLKKNR